MIGPREIILISEIMSYSAFLDIGLSLDVLIDAYKRGSSLARCTQRTAGGRKGERGGGGGWQLNDHRVDKLSEEGRSH